MEIDEWKVLSNFCCEQFDKYTKTPDKCLSLDPWAKEFQNSFPQNKICIFTKEAGVAVSEVTQFLGRQVAAGHGMVPIDYCPFCGKVIEFKQKISQ